MKRRDGDNGGVERVWGPEKGTARAVRGGGREGERGGRGREGGETVRGERERQ